MSRESHIAKVEYLKDKGFTGHIENVNYWYRKVYSLHRDKVNSVTEVLRIRNGRPASPETKGVG